MKQDTKKGNQLLEATKHYDTHCLNDNTNKKCVYILLKFVCSKTNQLNQKKYESPVCYSEPALWHK